MVLLYCLAKIMELKDFSLSVNNKSLFENVNVTFKEGTINHILGKNGTGKTCLVKAIIGAMPYTGSVKFNTDNFCAIGSYTNLPLDLKTKDVIEIAQRNFKLSVVESLIDKLNIQNIPLENKLKNLSDGQKQKLKLLFFLSTDPQLVVLDEFTNALDKKSCLDIYDFLNSYIGVNQITIINITHNLTDIEYLKGNYYLIEEKSIISDLTKENVVNLYIKG